MPITAFYAALLAMLFMVLSFRTIEQRRNARVEIGTGEDAELLRRYRVHVNFAEYVPFALLLLGLAESLKARTLFSTWRDLCCSRVASCTPTACRRRRTSCAFASPE